MLDSTDYYRIMNCIKINPSKSFSNGRISQFNQLFYIRIQWKMNIFRLTADLAHLVAIAILLAKIWKTRSCAGMCHALELLLTWRLFVKGISGRSQLMFLLVFVCRYLDLFTNFVSFYNTLMKVFLFYFEIHLYYKRNSGVFYRIGDCYSLFDMD